MGTMDLQAILEHLPQRYPFLMVDRVLEYKVEESLIAIKNVSVNEPYFNGHFPGRPIMPGVLIIEALAQASGILAIKTAMHRGGTMGNDIYYFAAIESARFKKPVLPGDQLLMKITLLNDKKGIWKFSTEASVDNQIVCQAVLTSARKEASS